MRHREPTNALFGECGFRSIAKGFILSRNWADLPTLPWAAQDNHSLPLLVKRGWSQLPANLCMNGGRHTRHRPAHK